MSDSAHRNTNIKERAHTCHTPTHSKTHRNYACTLNKVFIEDFSIIRCIKAPWGKCAFECRTYWDCVMHAEMVKVDDSAAISDSLFSHHYLLLMNYFCLFCGPRKMTMYTVSYCQMKRVLKHSFVLTTVSTLSYSLRHGVHIVRCSSRFGTRWHLRHKDVHFLLRYTFRQL